MGRFFGKQAVFDCHEVSAAAKLRSASMTTSLAADRTSFDPLGAGGLLLGVLATCVGAGAGIGALAGSLGIGVAIGSVIGIPAAIFTVYRTYRGSF
jgi:hypothetical protein